MTSEEDFAEKMMRRTFTAFYEYYNRWFSSPMYFLLSITFILAKQICF